MTPAHQGVNVVLVEVDVVIIDQREPSGVDLQHVLGAERMQASEVRTFAFRTQRILHGEQLR